VALTKLMDGSVLLARHGATTVEQVHAALGALGTVSARVLGTVLTAAPGTGLQHVVRGDDRAPTGQQADGVAFPVPPLTQEGAALMSADRSVDDMELEMNGGSDPRRPSPKPRAMDVATVQIPVPVPAPETRATEDGTDDAPKSS
jgi:hypothetical protein